MPMVMRAPYGGGMRALERHSESREAFWVHMPGLKMVIASGSRNARALLLRAIRDPRPGGLLRTQSGLPRLPREVPEDEEALPLGQAQVVRVGRDITLISYGAMLHPTLSETEGEAAEAFLRSATHILPPRR